MQVRHDRCVLWLAVWLGLAFAVPLAPSLAATPAASPAMTAAQSLFTDSITLRRSGEHNALLRAMRHLRDPALKPYFEALAEAEHPVLQVHGILGLAELSSPASVDLVRVAALESDPARAELIGAALDGDLLTDADARKLLTWKDLDPGVKLLIAAKQIARGNFDQPDILRDPAIQSSLPRRSLAALLLLQAGDNAGLEGLKELDRSTDPTRDAVRHMLLQTALQHDLRTITPWAYAIATDPDTESNLSTLALRVAIRFGDKRAVDNWLAQLAAAQDYVDRIRLALLGLQLSPWMDAEAFATLKTDADPFLQQVGRTASAIAAGDKDTVIHIVKLLETHHPAAARWALSYAQDVAPAEDRYQILLGLILIDEQGPAKGRDVRLANAAEAARILINTDPATGRNLLRPIIASTTTDRQLCQAILLGIVRSKPLDAGGVVTGLPDFTDPTTNQLALLLRLRAREPLTPAQRKDAAIIVRGGGGLQAPLRIQAAWLLLQQDKQTDALLAAVFPNRRP